MHEQRPTTDVTLSLTFALTAPDSHHPTRQMRSKMRTDDVDLIITRTPRFSVINIASRPAGASAASAPAAASRTEERRDTRERLLAQLRACGVDFQQSTLASTRTSAESAAILGATLASGAKAMLLLRDNGTAAILCVLSASKRVDWKKLKKQLHKGLRLATEDKIWAWTGCVPGAVPPFGSVFAPRPAQTVMDVSLQTQGGTMNFNAGLRTESVQMGVADYVRVEQPSIADIAANQKHRKNPFRQLAFFPIALWRHVHMHVFVVISPNQYTVVATIVVSIVIRRSPPCCPFGFSPLQTSCLASHHKLASPKATLNHYHRSKSPSKERKPVSLKMG